MENKRGIIDKLKEIDESMDSTEAVKIVRDLMAQWNSIGHVPFKEKDKIYKEYQSLLDTLFSRLERKMQKIREDMQLIEQKVQLIDKNL